MWSDRWRTNKPTILVAEHDRVIRTSLARALRPAYCIVEACSAPEAVRTAAQHEREIDLLLTEARLPGPFGGWQLLQLRKLDYPKLKVVYISKTIDSEIKAHTRQDKVLVLEHPFPNDCLRRAVREALESPHSRKCRCDVQGSLVSRAYAQLLQKVLVDPPNGILKPPHLELSTLGRSAIRSPMRIAASNPNEGATSFRGRCDEDRE